MLLEQDLFTELQVYAKLPGESLSLYHFDNLFSQLVFIMLTGVSEFVSDYWEVDFRLHLYQSITPIDLVRNTVSRPPRRWDQDSEDSEDWDEWLRRYDARNAENDSDGDDEGNGTKASPAGTSRGRRTGLNTTSISSVA
jgi:hypothetical protein